MTSVKIIRGKALLGRLCGGNKKSIACETMIPFDAKQMDGVIDDPTIGIDISFQTATHAAYSPNNSEHSTLNDAKRSIDLDDMPRFFYEPEAHEDSPYVSIFSDH